MYTVVYFSACPLVFLQYNYSLSFSPPEHTHLPNFTFARADTLCHFCNSFPTHSVSLSQFHYSIPFPFPSLLATLLDLSI